MKKIISVIALIVIASMIMITPVFGVEDFERDYGQDIFKANKLTKAPVIDGKVSAEEYGQITSAKTEPNAWMHCMPLGNAGFVNTYDKISVYDPRLDAEWAYLKDRTIKQLDTWFAYDDENIYIAYYQLSGVWDSVTDGDTTAGNGYDEYIYLSNYVIRVGFNMGNAFDLIQMEISSPRFADGVVDLKAVTTNDRGTGLRFSFTGGNKAGNEFNGGTALESCTDVLVGAAMSKHLVDGTAFQGSANSKKGQYIECVEIALSKQALLDAYNDEIGRDLDKLPEAMWFFFGASHYSWNNEQMIIDPAKDCSGQTMWFGTEMSSDESDDYGKPFEYYPDLVIIGDNFELPEDTEESTPPADTTPVTTPDTTPVTTPVTTPDTTTNATPPTSSDTANAGSTSLGPKPEDSSQKSEEDDEGGCGSAVTAIGFAVVAALGACAVVVEKKKR